MAEEKKCQATTSDGDSCNNRATVPEDNPVACHIKSHQKQLGALDNKEDKEMADKKEVKETKEDINEENADIPEVKETKEDIIEETNDIPEVKTHVFASEHLTHTIFIRYPEDDEREYFRAQFTGGRFETDNDEKAKLLEEHIKGDRKLKQKIKKLQ